MWINKNSEKVATEQLIAASLTPSPHEPTSHNFRQQPTSTQKLAEKLASCEAHQDAQDSFLESGASAHPAQAQELARAERLSAPEHIQGLEKDTYIFYSHNLTKD